MKVNEYLNIFKSDSDFDPDDWERFKNGEMVMTIPLSSSILIDRKFVEEDYVLDYEQNVINTSKRYKYITYATWYEKTSNMR